MGVHSMSEAEAFVPKFDATKRKKKRTTKKKKAVEDEEPEVGETTVAAPSVDASAKPNAAEGDSIADKHEEEEHTYEELLARVFEMIQERHPNLIAKKSKTVLTIPEVLRSTKKTVWHNFERTADKCVPLPRCFYFLGK